MEELAKAVCDFLKSVEKNGDLLVLDIDRATYKQIQQFYTTPVNFQVSIYTVWEDEEDNYNDIWEDLITISSSNDKKLYIEYTITENDEETHSIGKYISSVEEFKSFINKAYEAYKANEDYEDIAEELQESI